MDEKIILLILISLIVITTSYSLTCTVYLTEIGCPHCAKTDPVILKDVLSSNISIIEYELTSGNGPIAYMYFQKYHLPQGVPNIIFSDGHFLVGDNDILKNFNSYEKEYDNNECLLLNGSKNFFDLDFNSLPGSPKIWYKDKVVIKGKQNISNQIVRNFLFKDIIPNGTKLSYVSVPYSGGEINFRNGIKYHGWVFLWNRTSKKGSSLTTSVFSKINLTLPAITSLALVDAINPCALAVCAMMLIAIMTYNPKKRYKVLLAGLAFSFTVYVMYFLYGLVIVKAFQLIQSLVFVKDYIYKGVSIFAVLIGLLELKDYFNYKKGTLFTEMPLSFRPKVKKLIEGITSPLGASLIGAFVTIFLLPCTMGPYIITGGILSKTSIIKSILYLLYYDFIFIIPMLVITLLVYFGMRRVQDVYGWRNRNIRKLHLIAGILLMIVGILLLL